MLRYGWTVCASRMQPFETSSYRSQVVRLRRLAARAVNHYPVRVRSLVFLNHGENATFRVDDEDGQRYLLRVHRPGFHTRDAIGEELRWLDHLSRNSDVTVPVPVRSVRDQYVEAAAADGVPEPRLCTLMRWVDGRFSRQRITPTQVFELGRVMGELHARSNQLRLSRRRYWDSDGLVGHRPKLGPIDALTGASARHQETLLEARRVIHRRLREHEARFPQHLGLIHADLHFGNVLFKGGRLSVIDFDDCGTGFFAYDLAIPLISLRRHLKGRMAGRFDAYKEALISGYATRARWDAESERILPYLIGARKISLLAWAQSRSDHPRLRAFLRKAIPRTVRDLQTDLGIR